MEKKIVYVVLGLACILFLSSKVFLIVCVASVLYLAYKNDYLPIEEIKTLIKKLRRIL